MSFPDINIPWIDPHTDYCILRVNRTFDGVFEGQEETPWYHCDETATTRFNAGITWKITAAPGCDESEKVLPGGLLTSRGTTFLRRDGFAHYLGRFRIANTDDVTLFTGTLELIGRIGSHQLLGEPCDAREHVEGWLVGRGEGPAERYMLRVVVVGEAVLEPGVHGFLNTAVNRLTGTLFRTP